MTPDASYSDRLKWAEEHGSKNLGEKFTTGDNMNKEAQTTLTYVLTAMGGTFAFAFQALSGDSGAKDGIRGVHLNPLIAGVAFMCLYFTLLGIFLVLRTMLIGEFPSPYQEPLNLTKDKDRTLDEVRDAEIRAITIRIAQANVWIGRKSRAINLARVLLVVSPVVFVCFVAACVNFKWV